MCQSSQRGSGVLAKGRHQTFLQEGQEGGLGELQAGQPHLGPWEGDRQILLQPFPGTRRTGKGLRKLYQSGKEGDVLYLDFSKGFVMPLYSQIGDIWAEGMDDVVGGKLAGGSSPNVTSGRVLLAATYQWHPSVQALGPTLLNVSINCLYNVTECLSSSFVDDAKLGRALERPHLVNAVLSRTAGQDDVQGSLPTGVIL
ncbi:hypothetical protein QYF61_006981 [Mycteria americana]|uniref:Uncharacterized protein n=1 Tax=Mycteria americana TaxID=33587 RepID=A0AAN7MHQ7_MYCAM|nr:hypothetical protein QYF61_006981 [Mycteria americana]